ncbi:MAG: type II toxin-antitoxin system VapB family antitoxin [Verrucomicrobiaceae bacterium]|nr:MAG: type II toxin-antitoxin system VapB family antitoxin [Verrucomicrobiaceae bacterium]
MLGHGIWSFYSAGDRFVRENDPWRNIWLADYPECHTVYGMKMTMHIDEELLDRVIAAHGFASKTEAVEMALREMDRKVRLKEYFKNGLGLTPEELGNAFDPNYDVMALRAAEIPKKYGRRRAH